MHMLSKELMKLLEKDIRKVVDAGEIKPTDYPCLSTAVDIYKDLTTIVAMEEAQEQQQNSYNSYGGGSYGSYGNGGSGMSGRQSYMDPGMRGNWAMDSYDGYSGNGYSGARGRSPYTGRYVSRDADPMMKLNEMMANAKTPEEQNMIRRMMDEMER